MNFRGGTLRYNFADGDIDINFQKILNNYTVRTTKFLKLTKINDNINDKITIIR